MTLVPGDVVHREDARAGVALDRLRDDDRLEFLEVLADQAQVAGFLHVIELSFERDAEFGDHADEVVTLASAGAAGQELRDLLERLEIGRDGLRDVRPLHLDRDDAARRASAARCTWPSDAAAIGVSSNIENAFDRRAPSSSSTIRCTSGNGNGLTLSCSRVSASR